VSGGEHGTTVVYADRFVPDDEKRRARETGEDPQAVPFLKRFTIFNAAQCDGLPGDVAVAPPPGPGLIEPKVEALIKASGIDFRIGGNRAFYVPAYDYVMMPPPPAFFEPINCHRTALDECSHASGAPHRLNRDLSGSFGSKTYAFEELVAEISAAARFSASCRLCGTLITLAPGSKSSSRTVAPLYAQHHGASKAADYLRGLLPDDDSPVTSAPLNATNR